MSRLLRTPEAQQDIEQIVQHIARDNLTAALRWLDDVEAICGLLVNQPEIGQQLQTRRFCEVRRHSHGNYLFYYRPTSAGVELLRVLHGSRDQERLV